ncbi:MAG: DUF3592 domain-containing protein [candidate division FCPU426 bacterium]
MKENPENNTSQNEKYAMSESSFVSRMLMTLCLLLAGYEIYLGVTQYVRGIWTEKWPSTTGMVADAKNVISQNLAYGGRTGGSVKTAYPKIAYTYTVDGQEYRGERIQFGMVFSRRGLIAVYPAGDQVTVYYQPDYPRQAVLIKGCDIIGILFTFGLAVFFIIAAALIWVFDRW